jgi:hypothetical protein
MNAATGVLAWTPVYADVGTHPVTLTVADGDGGTDTETFTIVVAFQDDDGDGLPDTWEIAAGLDPTTDDAALDFDGDGLSNLDEFLGGTDPASYDGPDAPVPTAPVPGGEVDTSTPVLSWTNATDPQTDTLTYEVEVYSDAAMTAQLTSTAGLVEDGSGTTSWPVDVVLAENSDMTWRVRAADPYTPGPWSDADFFVNEVNEPPTAPVASAPLSGDRADVLRPSLSWSDSSDVDRDALTYEVRVWNEARDAVVAEAVGVSGDAREASWTVDRDLSEDTEYSWEVRAVDEHGLPSEWSEAQDFLVSTTNAAPTDVAWIEPTGPGRSPGSPRAAPLASPRDQTTLQDVGDPRGGQPAVIRSSLTLPRRLAFEFTERNARTTCTFRLGALSAS